MGGIVWQDSAATLARPVRVPDVLRARSEGRRLVAVTAYDAPSAALAEAAGVDIVLVGDSLGTVIQGRDDTLAVTLDEMIYHARCVRRGMTLPLLVVDLPFGTFQRGAAATLDAAIRVLKETGAAAVKIEGGRRVLDSVRACTRQDIPVMGHLGLTPQSLHALGGYRKQAKDEAAADALLADAEALAAAGVFAIVLECVPDVVASRVRRAVDVPTIGIGAGPDCDGQVLVFHDVLGLLPQTPSFVRRFAELGQAALAGLKDYAAAVRSGSFPA